MRKALALAVLLLGMASPAWAYHCPQLVDSGTTYQCIQNAYNDSGSALTSGTVVVYDNDDTEFDRTGYPYVTTSTTADDPWTAGVILDNSCPAGALCTLVVHGFALTRIGQATDATAEDTLVGTTTVAGRAGDYGTAANACALGTLIEARNPETGGSGGDDNQRFPVWVNIDCD